MRHKQFVSARLHLISDHLAKSEPRRKYESGGAAGDGAGDEAKADIPDDPEAAEQPVPGAPRTSHEPVAESAIILPATPPIGDGESFPATPPPPIIESQPPQPVAAAAPPPPAPADPVAERGRLRDKAWRERRDEFVKTRREVMDKLAEAVSLLPGEISENESQSETMRKVFTLFERLAGELGDIDESSWNQENFNSELSKAMRQVENARLEYIRSSAKLSDDSRTMKLRQTNIPPSGGATSLIPEIASLSFSQVLRLGLAFTLPIALAILAAAILVGAAFFLSIRL